jgi:multiple antibiotic resistance protein
VVTTSLFSIALTLFLVANPIGNSPVILALIKDYDFERQKKIMLREAFFSFAIAIFFQLVGEYFLESIHVKQYSLSLCGGTLLFLVSLKMIFPQPESVETKTQKQEPFFVPIATPLVTGPGVMTMIMIFSRQETSMIKITGAIVLAFLGVAIVLYSAPYLNRLLGKRGMVALEQLMGMILSMISMQMVVKGAALYWQELARG